MNHIKFIGVELEGAWQNLDFERSQGWKHDGSVSIKLTEKLRYIGEVVSQPMSLNAVLSWADRNYPDYTNRSCGGHLHFSFKSIDDYIKLLDRKFFYTMLEELKEWGLLNNLNSKGVFWERIEGKNEYCLKEFYPDRQLKGQTGERYTMINPCWNKHGTIEIRILPCFQKKRIYLNAVKFMYNFIENYLKDNKDQKIEIKKRVFV